MSDTEITDLYHETIDVMVEAGFCPTDDDLPAELAWMSDRHDVTPLVVPR